MPAQNSRKVGWQAYRREVGKKPIQWRGCQLCRGIGCAHFTEPRRTCARQAAEPLRTNRIFDALLELVPQLSEAVANLRAGCKGGRPKNLARPRYFAVAKQAAAAGSWLQRCRLSGSGCGTRAARLDACHASDLFNPPKLSKHLLQALQPSRQVEGPPACHVRFDGDQL